jgi:hypothetical protein
MTSWIIFFVGFGLGMFSGAIILGLIYLIKWDK